MTRFDLTPLYRSTVGFDRFASLLDSMTGLDGEASGYPPYNIERIDDNAYRITMAVAGFSEDDLNLDVKEGVLSVRGTKSEETSNGDENENRFLHRGIATRSFERRFQLADYVEVTGADLKDGLLHVDLKRELPETMKPRSIPIGAGSAKEIEVHA